MKLESLKSEKFKKLDSHAMHEIKGGLVERTGSGSLIGTPGGGIRTASSDTLIWDDNGGGLQHVSFVDAKTGLEISYFM
ncbi:hypothetical protein MP478_03125 [Chryseobacterium sp. WG14]|uniref:hypothetical protein n=1 Tax=unclassified Chryseobacterium TaxID=2593645 RepID=UPI001D66DBB7|nr:MULTISPECIES: hypothetical protein [unclassified Chryseobacterium]MCQ9633884.1 hypothetical protein [Chryseobacterium sp. WG23]MCQ9638368.1 hypothetical protein [Chryseobacterium sp. WG14]CAH0171766.1 hypothetical protein SRABI04_01270 [Chryseobacterium sp. Bi04]